jgi:hypothetical protein
MKTMKGSMFFVIPMALVIFALLAAPAPAGDLNPPPGSPAPTMKTLDQIPPTWDQKLRSDDGDATTKCNSTRFKCVMDGAAVLDKETGLVWEKAPDATPQTWADAVGYCFNKAVGGRKGWRLPTIEELASLVDPSAGILSLPDGHPFTNVQLTWYWSSTTRASETGKAWLVILGGGSLFDVGKTFPYPGWCVRGGRGHDGYPSQ